MSLQSAMLSKIDAFIFDWLYLNVYPIFLRDNIHIHMHARPSLKVRARLAKPFKGRSDAPMWWRDTNTKNQDNE